LSVVSCQLSVVSCQLSVVSWQLAVGSWQLAVGSWQLAMGSGQWAVGKGQRAVGSGHWATGNGHRPLYRTGGACQASGEDIFASLKRRTTENVPPLRAFDFFDFLGLNSGTGIRQSCTLGSTQVLSPFRNSMGPVLQIGGRPVHYALCGELFANGRQPPRSR